MNNVITEKSTIMQAFFRRLYAQNERVIKLGLGAMLAALDDGLQSHWPLILVGGTNGKGQVSHTIAQYLKMQGLKVGLFTSPHLVQYRERIRVNGEMIDEDALLRIGCEMLVRFGGAEMGPQLEQYLQSQGRSFSPSAVVLSYFELSLAIAQAFFAEQKIDFGVYEIGLGGRLDACNALEPELSVIVSISRDHTQYLGESLAKIAGEKAGIMRRGKPVILGRNEVEVLSQEAQSRGCSSVEVLGKDFAWRGDQRHWEINAKNTSVHFDTTSLLAEFQRDNAALAMAALLRLAEQKLLVWNSAIFAQCVVEHPWFGRFTKLGYEIAKAYGCREIILDAAHNEAGARALISALRSECAHFPLAMLVNACADKDVERIVAQYRELLPDDAIFVVPVAEHSRVLSPGAYCALNHLDSAQCCASIEEGLLRAGHKVGKQGCIVVTGSIYLLGETMQILGIGG